VRTDQIFSSCICDLEAEHELNDNSEQDNCSDHRHDFHVSHQITCGGSFAL
jgi:hypothetical protein